MALAEEQRQLVERHLRPAYLCGMPDGSPTFSTAFWVAGGTVA